jgi:multiple sugar transport system substrate-binding protein
MPHMTIRSKMAPRWSWVVAGVLAVGCSTSSGRRPPGETGTGGSSGSGGSIGTGGSGGTTTIGTGGTGANGDAVQLKIAWWGSPDRKMRTQKVLDKFTAAHPNITFVTDGDLASTDYWAHMKDVANANTLPDIMQQDYAYIEEWATKGRIIPLDDYIKAGGPIDLSDVAPSLVEGGRIKGKIYGVSLGSNTQAFILDVDMFKQAGVDLPPDTWTWEDFETISNQIHDKLHMWAYGIALYLYTPWKSLYLSKGQFVWNDTATALGYTDDQPFIDHWKMMLRLMNSGAILPYADERSMFPSANIELAPIVTSKAAMEQIQSNQITAIAAKAPGRNFKLVPLPREKGGGPSVYVKPSQFWSITSANKHPKESAQLIDFFTNDLAANQDLGAERGVPIAGKVLSALKTQLGPAQAEAFSLLDRVAKDGRKLPVNDPPQWSHILDDVYKPHMVIPIFAGTLTPEDGVATFRREVTSILTGTDIPDGGAVTPIGGKTDGGAVDAAEPDAAAPDGGVDGGVADVGVPDAASYGDVGADDVALEAEALKATGQGAMVMAVADPLTSGGQWVHLLSTKVGDSVDFAVSGVPAGSYQLVIDWKGNDNRGIAAVSVDGTQVGSDLDQYAPDQSYSSTALGVVTFATAGDHTVSLKVTGKNAASKGSSLGADRFVFAKQ